MSAMTEAAGDAIVITKRNLIKIKRVPDLLVFTTLSPIMFVLLFAYVFGSAINVPGVGYKEFLIAGIFVQTVVFGSTFTGYSLAEDLQKGIIDRFRSLPMAPSAVLYGRTLSDVVNNVISLAVMALTGLIVGWRIHTSFARGGAGLRAAPAVRLRHLLGDGTGRPAGADPRDREQRGVHRDLPADVHRQHVRADQQLPGAAEDLRRTGTRCRRSPRPPGSCSATPARCCPVPDVWPLQNPVAYSLIWVVLLLAVFIPLSIRQYGKAASR